MQRMHSEEKNLGKYSSLTENTNEIPEKGDYGRDFKAEHWNIDYYWIIYCKSIRLGNVTVLK